MLAGAPLWDLPPANLEELASFLGNQGLGELLERRGLQVQEAAFRLPPEEPETSPFPVPEESAALVQAPEGLASGEASGVPFDPAGLLE